jgi:hypothetical protein
MQTHEGLPLVEGKVGKMETKQVHAHAERWALYGEGSSSVTYPSPPARCVTQLLQNYDR